MRQQVLFISDAVETNVSQIERIHKYYDRRVTATKMANLGVRTLFRRKVDISLPSFMVNSVRAGVEALSE